MITAQICGGLESQDVEKRSFLKVFVEKMTPYMGEFPKFCSERIHRDIG